MIQRVDWLVLLQVCCNGVFLLSKGASEPLCEDLELSEFLEQGLMGEELDVLGPVVRLGGGVTLRHLLQVVGLARVDALQDAQTTEVRQTQAKLLQRLVAREVVCHGSRFSLDQVNRKVNQ